MNKNEIIVFSEKIKAIGAAQGYFLATSFTKDAKAQAKKDNRMTLRTVTEHDPLQLSDFKSFDIHHEYKNFQPVIYARDGQPWDALLTSLVLIVRYKGSTEILEKLVVEWCREVAKERLRGFASDKPTGVYDFDYDFVRNFSPGELAIRGRDIATLHIFAMTTAEVYQRPIISSFEIESRGRVIVYEDLEMRDGFREKDSRLIMWYDDKDE